MPPMKDKDKDGARKKRMNDAPDVTPDDTVAGDPRVDALVADYIDRLNRGDTVDPQQVLTEQPELGMQVLSHLKAFLDLDEETAAGVDADHAQRLGTIGDYKLLRKIGQGGMGIVYEAWQSSLDRQVAFKILPSAMAGDSKVVARFVREARVAAKLHHAHIVSVYGMGLEAETPYYAMLTGQSPRTSPRS